MNTGLGALSGLDGYLPGMTFWRVGYCCFRCWNRDGGETEGGEGCPLDGGGGDGGVVVCVC